MITTTPAAPGARGLSTEMHDGVAIHRVAARIPGGYPVHPRAAHHVTRILRESRPDVVHLHMGVLTPSVQVSLKPVARLGLPAVLTVHSVWGSAERWFAALDRVTHWSRLPILLSAVSELTAAPLRRIAGPDVPVEILHNGLDLDEWAVPRVERDARAGSTAVHLVAATRFAPRKRVLPMLESIRSAAARLPRDAVFATIAGRDPSSTRPGASSPSTISRECQPPGRLGPDELKRLYSRADVFLAPAIQESFGIAALEGRAAGLAVVTRAESGVAERLTDGSTGCSPPTTTPCPTRSCGS
ncbi:glycosyltransferase family 4 protein [Oerskovia sp. M15]